MCSYIYFEVTNICLKLDLPGGCVVCPEVVVVEAGSSVVEHLLDSETPSVVHASGTSVVVAGSSVVETGAFVVVPGFCVLVPCVKVVVIGGVDDVVVPNGGKSPLQAIVGQPFTV